MPANDPFTSSSQGRTLFSRDYGTACFFAVSILTGEPLLEGIEAGGRRRDRQNEIVSRLIVTQKDFHILQVSFEYPFNRAGDLAEVMGSALISSPFGWFLIVPSSLRVAYKHLHGLALSTCLGRLSSNSARWTPHCVHTAHHDYD
jgi:hypothetical protein